MKQILGFIGILLVIVAIGIGISYASGWIGVHQTETIGKAQRNADRKVYEKSTSYIQGKRAEAVKMYKEYLMGDEDTKSKIEKVVSLTFAEVTDEMLNDIADGELKQFIKNCKCGKSNSLYDKPSTSGTK
jgi:DNA-directed RNA polymerase beta' subunit